jgi:hypothetical protein
VRPGFWRPAAAVLVCFALVTGVYSQTKQATPAASKPTPPLHPAPTIPAPAAKVYKVLQEFLDQLELRSAAKNPPDKVVRLTEAEVNAYLKEEVRIKAEKYPGLQSLSAKFISSNYIGVTASIDFKKVKQLDSNFALRSMQTLLNGVQQIYAEGTLTSADRTGQFQLEKAYLGSIRIPVTLIEFLIKNFAKPQDQPVELSRPFLLPYGLKKADIQAGSITLHG